MAYLFPPTRLYDLKSHHSLNTSPRTCISANGGLLFCAEGAMIMRASVEMSECVFLLSRKKSKELKEAKRMVCDCSLPMHSERMRGVHPCGEDCLNRMLMIEWSVYFRLNFHPIPFSHIYSQLLMFVVARGVRVAITAPTNASRRYDSTS